MARALLRQTVIDLLGNAVVGATITVREPGTVNPIAAAMHDALTGGNVLGNPLTTDANGSVTAFLDAEQEVDLLVTEGLTSRTVPAVAIGVGGAATPDFTLWSPDAPPLVAGALDVEFQQFTIASGLPASMVADGWFEFDPDGIQAVAIDGPGLMLGQPAHASDNVTGICIAIPAGDLSIATKLCAGHDLGAFPIGFGGIALFEDATDSTKRIVVFAVGWANLWQVMEFADYQTFTAALFGGNDTVEQYIRLRRTAVQYNFDISAWGLSFADRDNLLDHTIAFVPQHVGLIVNNNTATAMPAQVGYAFFRHIASDVGLAGRLDGARVGGFYA